MFCEAETIASKTSVMVTFPAESLLSAHVMAPEVYGTVSFSARLTKLHKKPQIVSATHTTLRTGEAYLRPSN